MSTLVVATSEMGSVLNLLESDESSSEELLIALGRVDKWLERTSFSFEQNIIFYRLSMPSNKIDSMGEFSDFFRSIQGYLNYEVMDFVLGNDTNKSREEIIQNVEELYEGLYFLLDNLIEGELINSTPNDILLAGNYDEVKSFWSELMQDIVKTYPDNQIYEYYYRLWYG